jgi:alpha-L-rhamnosidase
MLKLEKLLIEYRKNPLGLDVKKPGFSWVLASDGQNVMQTAYRICVKHDGKVVWDSQKVESDRSIHVIYEGEELLPQSIYIAEITVWDNHGNQAEISGTFETGLLDYKNFTGKWITHTLEETEACPVFKKSFKTKGKVRRARIYATALGVYEIQINDKKVGEDFFAPGWTNYRKRIQYQTYDVTDRLEESSQLSMTVANGWYKGILGFTNEPNHYGDRVAALLELHIWYDNGAKEVIATDESWECTTGVIRCSEIYNGETINTTYVSPGGNPVKLIDMDYSRLVAQEAEPVRITKRIKPVSFILTPKGEAVLDFGQNMAGIVEVKVKGLPGQKIVIRHAEVLDKNGNFYTENLRGAKATDTYICNGEEQVFLPHFTFHGFRYIAVEGRGTELNLDNFTACALHTDMEQTGAFTCSHPLINRLQLNIEWGQRSNFLDIPTDCPQRDERLGWTGDAQVFCKTAAFNFNTALFFRKWLRDLASEQTVEFGVPHVVPNILGNQEGAAAWGDAATIIPWTMYQVYGDVRVLKEQYESMKAWVEYIRARETQKHLWQSGFQYADWLALDKEEGESRTGSTDVYLIATAFYAYSTQLVCEAAKILGYEDDYEEYHQLYQQIREGFNEEYITKTGRMVSETQTACVLALYMNLAKDEYKARIMQSLATNLANHKNHLTTGFVGTPYICHVLTQNGRHDLAGKLLLQEDYPSWLYEVKMGATTIWERWNSIKPDGSFDESGMNSFNHYAYGSIGDWMYQWIAGIQMAKPAYKQSILAPKFIKGLTSAKASVETMYGRLSCSWECKDGVIKVDVTVPVNTTAILYLPENDEPIELGSGTYHYSYATDTKLEIDRFSMESTLGQILAEPLAVELLEQHSPGMMSNPMTKLAYDKSIAELCSFMPAGGEQLFRAVIDALNKRG